MCLQCWPHTWKGMKSISPGSTLGMPQSTTIRMGVTFSKGGRTSSSKSGMTSKVTSHPKLVAWPSSTWGLGWVNLSISDGGVVGGGGLSPQGQNDDSIGASWYSKSVEYSRLSLSVKSCGLGFRRQSQQQHAFWSKVTTFLFNIHWG